MKRAKAAEGVEAGAGASPVKPADLAVDLESDPLTRPEYISAIVHLYRGELHRANAWRMRLDNTTNWAVLTTAGLLTFSFGDGRDCGISPARCARRKGLPHRLPSD